MYLSPGHIYNCFVDGNLNKVKTLLMFEFDLFSLSYIIHATPKHKEILMYILTTYQIALKDTQYNYGSLNRFVGRHGYFDIYLSPLFENFRIVEELFFGACLSGNQTYIEFAINQGLLTKSRIDWHRGLSNVIH